MLGNVNVLRNVDRVSIEITIRIKIPSGNVIVEDMSQLIYNKFRDKPASIHDFLKGDYGYLQPKLFKHLNPFSTSEEAIKAEGESLSILEKRICSLGRTS